MLNKVKRNTKKKVIKVKTKSHSIHKSNHNCLKQGQIFWGNKINLNRKTEVNKILIQKR